MANMKVSQLNQATSINENDITMIVQNGENKKVTLEKVRENVKSVNINALPEKTVTTSTDYVLITDANGVNRKVPVSAIKGSGTGSGGAVSVQDLDWSKANETIAPDDTNYVLVNDGTTTKKVKLEKIKGANNLTDKYVEVIGDDGNSYRLAVQNGKIHVYDAEIDTAAEHVAGTDSLTACKGLIINKVFAGGAAIDKASCSHNFIELYNLGKNTNLGTDKPGKSINLKGLYLFYKVNGGAWVKYPLKGIIPENTSFLIRGKYISNPDLTRTRVNVNKYDLDIPGLDLSLTKGFTLLLYIGSDDINDADLVRDRRDPITGAVTWTNTRYIDMLGLGIKDGDNPPHSEGSRWKNIMSLTTGAMREDFANSGLSTAGNKEAADDNFSNINEVDYTSCDIVKFGPKSLIDGKWDYYITREGLSPFGPNMLNMCYGADASTTRTFTWHTLTDFKGFIKYRKVGDTTWKMEESSIETVTTLSGSHYVHRAIISELTTGQYEYLVGREGAWSDSHGFEVKDYSATPIKFILTSDEQGFTVTEYDAVKTSADFIEANEEFDFHMNTGDITQNANVTFEWLSYFNFYDSNRDVCHMATCGNNDLTDNKYLDMYSYFNTHENSIYPSSHGWDIGCTHFVCLNSNDVTGFVHNGTELSPTNFVNAQAIWLDQHLAEVMQRTNKPKWIVVYMHYSPFTVVRDAKRQRFVEVFEKYKVDLVLSGHNHQYSKSIPIYSGFESTKSSVYNKYADSKSTTGYAIVNEVKGDGTTEINRTPDVANGTYYVMSQATGFKLRTGKEKVINMRTVKNNFGGEIADFDTKHTYNGEGVLPWWSAKAYEPQNPMYMAVEITEAKIDVKVYEIQNVLEYGEQKDITVHPYIATGVGAQTKNLVDTITILHSERTTGR